MKKKIPSKQHFNLRHWNRPDFYFTFNSAMNNCRQLKVNFSVLKKNVILPKVKWKGDVAFVETINGEVQAKEGDYLFTSDDKFIYEKVLSEKEFRKIKSTL